MKPLNPDHLPSSNPSQPPLVRGGARFALPLSRGSWRGFASNRQYGLLTALLLACIPNANAASLGRLFFTPEQRTHLDYTYARNAPVEGNASPFFTVNGIVQKQGGARTVWVNGVSQNVDNTGERTPTTQTVTIPGKSQVMKMKVGDKILLDQPAPSPQTAPGE